MKALNWHNLTFKGHCHILVWGADRQASHNPISFPQTGFRPKEASGLPMRGPPFPIFFHINVFPLLRMLKWALTYGLLVREPRRFSAPTHRGALAKLNELKTAPPFQADRQLAYHSFSPRDPTIGEENSCKLFLHILPPHQWTLWVENKTCRCDTWC